MTNRKVANINIKIRDLFLKWLEITRVFHDLTKREMEILSLFLYYHYQLKKEVTNEKILWTVLFDYDTKAKIKEDLGGLGDQSLQNALTSFRRKGIVKNNTIVKAYIPELDLDSNKFSIIFNFNIVDE